MRLTRLQQALLAAAAALLLVLVATFRRIPRPPREAPPAAASTPGPAGVGQPTTLLSGFDYSESSAGRTRFSVHADRTVGFAPGVGTPSTWYGLERVALTIFSGDGRPLTVHSDAADYDPRTRAMHLKGNVVATDTRGTSVRTASAQFDPGRALLDVPAAIEFSRGPVRGRAASGRFATQTRVLTLAGPVTGEGEPGAPFDTLSANAAEYRESEGVATFTGDVRAARAGDTLSCDTLSVRFGAENRVESAFAEGRVSGTIVSGTERAAWTAAAARSAFDADGQPARVELTGGPAVLTAPASAGQPERRLTAPRIVLGLRAGSIASADGEGGVRLERTVAAADGSPSVEWIEGDAARAAFAGGTIASVRFEGNVRGRSAEGESRSPAASYSAATAATSFLGTAGSDAELLSPRGRILGRQIDVDQASGRVTATGDARAILPPGTATTSAPSFVASGKAPTRARADRIVLDDRRRTAVLTGSAALWQGDDSVMADRIELHDADRTALAEGSVRVAGRTAGEATPRGNPRIAVSADTMHWKDAARTGTFEGNVAAARGLQTARGDRGECRVDADGRIERTVLDGDVSFADRETGRSGRGARAVDDPKAGVTNLAGDPAVAQDAQGNRVQGAVLTFRKQSGSVEVKAKEGGRVESVYQTHGS